MFFNGDQVAWATKANCFLGTILSSNEKSSVIIVTSQMTGRQLEGKKVVVNNAFLGKVENGKAIVTMAK